jgi:large subunit ribosomal protein L24
MATKKEAKQARRAKRKTHVVKGDRVRVIRGNFRELEGTVMRVDASRGQVTVEGVNMRKRHRAPTPDNPDGGIVTFEAPVDISNVMLVDPSSDEPSRVRVRVEKDGTKERIAVKTGNPIPRP